jgi:Icc protein
MATDLTVLHITDPHLLREPGAQLHGWDVAAAFERALSAALAAYPAAEAIVLGGDLVDDESAAGYRWLDARLIACGRPILAIAGNHDDPRTMAEHLFSTVVHGVLRLVPWRLVGLSSHRPGQENGRIGDTQLAQLEATLAADSAPTLVCVHHPPFAVGSVWIDAIGLTDADALTAMLSQYAHVRGILCGHVHQSAEHCIDGIPAWTTPSTMRQFRPGAMDFAEDTEHGPGYRSLRLTAGGDVITSVHRLVAPASVGL